MSSSYRPIANATPLGLLAFGTTTAILSAGLCTIAEKDRNAALTVGFAFGFGGVVQFLAGIIEFVRNNEFSATAFCVYGGFWLSYGVWKIMETTGVFVPDANTLSYYSAAWAVVTFILLKRLKSTWPSRCSLRTSPSSSSSSPRRNKRVRTRSS
jgi:succinate-acetate transporter protein